MVLFDLFFLHFNVLAQVGRREQVLEGLGWKMLPGLYPTGKPLDVDVSYKASKLLLSGHSADLTSYHL